MNKLLLRLGAVGAIAAGTVWAVRKYDLVTKAQVLAVQAAGTVQELAGKAGVYVDETVTKFTAGWLDLDGQGTNNQEQASEAAQEDPPAHDEQPLDDVVTRP